MRFCLKAVLAERTAEAHRTILGELLALRKILLNLQFTVAAGEPVTRDRMLAWIEEADADKGEKRGRGSRPSPPGELMDDSWGARRRRARWIRTRPAWALSAALVAVVSVIGLGQYRYSRWTPLQRFYFPAHVRSTILDAVGVTKPGRYALLTVMDRRGPRLAVDTDVEASSGASNDDAFTLTAAARSAGIRGPVVTTDRYDSQALHTFLLTWIYQGRRLRDLAWPPLAGGLGVLVLGLLVAIPQDAERARARRQGRRLRGPELVTPGAFTRRLRADGVGWMQAGSRGLFSRSRPAWVRVPHAVESSHFLVMGDTGTGKSALIRQLLLQVQERGRPRSSTIRRSSTHRSSSTRTAAMRF